MENVSNDDLRTILNYLDLDTSGNRSILLDRIQENCRGKQVRPRPGIMGHAIHSNVSSDSESEDHVPRLPIQQIPPPRGQLTRQFPLPRGELMRQTSDTVNPHGRLLNRVYLFNSLIFIDVYDDDENDRLCLRMTFPNTPVGNANNRRLITTYQDLLTQNTRYNLINLNIFVPSFVTTSGKLFTCDLDIYDSIRRVRYSRAGEVVGDKILEIKTAESMKSAITPNSKGLFKLLECVMVAVEYLHRIRFNLQSLDLETIVYSNPAQYLVTSFSSDDIDLNNYKVHLTRFLTSIDNIGRAFVKENRKTILDNTVVTSILNDIKLVLLTPLQSAPSAKLEKVLQETFRNYIGIKTRIERLENRKKTKK